jgi:methylase of polypeptide subunit release factors
MLNDPMSISKREAELDLYLDKQPYLTELDGIQLQIAKNVFPSDFGITSSFFGHYMLQRQPVQNALDMGCGSGYFALLLKKIGCKTVLGVDFNIDAFNCAKGNALLNPQLGIVDFMHSDLFVNVPPQNFNLIVFNFNYYPSNGNFGLNADGGREILNRFFSQVTHYITPESEIFIPYSEFVGTEHNPKLIAQAHGFITEVVATITNQTGLHFIYKIMQA